MPTRAYGSINLERVEHAITDAGGPAPEVLGVVNPTSVTQAPPPPWEVEKGYQANDARGFVDVPSDWTLRWLNPRVIDRDGWRYWQKVDPADSRVKVKVPSMIQVDNTIRRGGVGGDILAWMHTSWVESMREKLRRAAEDLAGTAEEKREALNEEFKRGTFGDGIHGEARHTATPVNARTFGTITR